MEIDWDMLRAAATDAMRGAYAPYSRFPVGAAALVDDGRVVRGCNVENASYGLTLCAECGVVSQLHATGGGRLMALSCVDGDGALLMPCGRCRQLLREHGGAHCLVDAPGGPLTIAELLPYAFDSVDLVRTGHGPDIQPAPHLRDKLGSGTVFVHQDSVDGKRVWTAYWDGTTGGGGAASILDEAPSRAEAEEVIAWGLARTRRVIVVDADGELFWAGEGPRPAEVPRSWRTR